ncbi:MAG: flavin reductase family protein [Chloroflexi bacterium]|nr:flavin reductase family protein [Chloroflexota bacterium]
MGKKELTAQCLIPVRPILLVGANIGGKANLLEIGSAGLASSDPPMMVVSIRHHQYTLKGILENRTFSVNVPSIELVKETDYCGIVSGAKTDKVRDCSFTIFYGKLTTAPMIEECPINLECSVVHVLGSNSHSTVIGRVDGTYVTEEFLADGKPDFTKLAPLLWFVNKAEYVTVGKTVGKSRSSGRELQTTH